MNILELGALEKQVVNVDIVAVSNLLGVLH